MPYYCTVPRCTSMAGKAKNVSFHQFPRDEELAELWNNILKRGKPYTKYSKVCSLHFKAEDYTITSVGKNKGQWRTLRKDAIPSQNLPSDSPLPYQRQRKSSSVQNTPPSTAHPRVQQQIAQAIYMQTMLAMQAGCAVNPAIEEGSYINYPSKEEHEEKPQSSSDTPDLESTSQLKSSYKCTECTKCFKDPDVFKLHQRTHSKNNGKENFNSNSEETLKSNPILANLLKARSSDIFDLPNNNVSLDNQIVFLAAHLENYLKSFVPSVPQASDSESDSGPSELVLDENA